MKHFLILFFIVTTSTLRAQQFIFTLSGGMATANPNAYNESATGYRITGHYEVSKENSKFAQGLSIGLVRTNFTDENSDGKTKFVIRTWPVYYTFKKTFGNNEKLKPFGRIGIGLHFPKYKATGATPFEKSDLGFYGGLGLGALMNLSENWFMSVEYEFAYLTNSYFENGILHTAQIGIGVKF